MTTQNTTANSSRSGPLAGLRAFAVRVLDVIAASSSVMACAREAERLMAMSDKELAARGLTRDRVVHHAFARYMGL